MPPHDDTKLRDAWMALYHTQEDTPEHDALFWAWERVNELCSDDPENALAFILAVLAHVESDRVLAVLAAGPLEDLMARHPYKMIARVEAEATTNPRSALLLGGVWQNAIPEDVWQRMQAVTPAKW